MNTINPNNGTKFYTFCQNNSGGSFIENTEEGIGEFVIVEAFNHKDANKRAEKIGLYFNGVENNIDCECCGNRWNEVDERDGETIPSIYGVPVGNTNYESYIHFINGDIKIIKIIKK